MSIVYNKLVRDKIPQIIEASGKTPVTRVASSNECRDLLRAKLSEEVDEYLSTGKVEELCDKVEVVSALARCEGLTVDHILELAAEKRDRRGGFEGRIVLLRVD